MAYEYILSETTNGVNVITLNRPKQLNALNKQTIEELHNALSDARENEAVRVIVITGSGEKAFVAGADIKEFADFNVQQGTELAAKGQELLFDFIENLNKPVIAAVNGYALGGGLELAMACHIRVASENALLGLPETSLGLIPGYGGTQRLTQLAGKGKAFEMIFTAKMIKAEEAASLGLVNQVVSAEELMPTVEKMAGSIMKNSSQAHAAAIKAINSGVYSEGFKGEITAFGEAFGTSDFLEGTTAFIEKRKPNF